MAYLDEDELIAIIRHEMRIEDEDGRCGVVLPPVARRAKYGGLPLDFRSVKREDEDEDGCHSPGFTISTDEDVVSTREFIDSRLRSRTADSDQLRTELDTRTKEEVEQDAEALFVGRSNEEVRRAVEARRAKGLSAISKSLAETPDATSTASSLNAYAVFEAAEGERGAKEVAIVYAMEEAIEEGVKMIELRVRNRAKIAEVCGLACLKFEEQTGRRLSGSPEQMLLYIAEESGEIDYDFPPLDSQNAIGDFGFRVLAMKQRSSDGAGDSQSTVYVYLPNGTRYTVELPHLHTSLRSLREKVLKMREAEMSEEELLAHRIVGEYNLEHVDQFDVPLDLDSSIASTGSTEFVLVRKNSSRDGFHPRGTTPADTSSALPTAVPPTPMTAKSPTMVFDFASPPDAMGIKRQNDVLEDGLIAEFRVERVHKYKPKWQARLAIRWNCIEVVPIPTERRLSNRFHGGPKPNLIAWEDIADARVKEKRNPAGGLSLVHVAVTFLPPPSSSMGGQTPTTPGSNSRTPSVLSSGETGLREIAARYRESDKWKVLILEVDSYSVGESVARLIGDGIKERNSVVTQVYSHSKGGTVRPGQAAEATLAFLRQLSSPLLPSGMPTRKRSSISAGLQRLLGKNEG